MIRTRAHCRGWLGRCLALVAAVTGVTAPSAAADEPGGVASRDHARTVFELNRGQTDERVKFLARGRGYTLFLTSEEAVLVLRGPRPEPAAVRMRFVGANPSPQIVGVEELPGKVNYFHRGDPARQVTAVATYAKVKYVEVYPGVDVVYYGRQAQFEYDFIVTPGADPAAITLAFESIEGLIEGLEVDARGDLVLRTSFGELRQPRPVIYQEIDGVRQAIAGEYVVNGERRVGVHVGPYDRSRPLVIDPVLVYATYLGGSGDEDDRLLPSPFGIARDTSGNIYVTGATQSSDFPTTSGADRTLDGGMDAFVTKLSPAGAVVYSTYLGGPCDDHGRGIAVDTGGNAYVTGRAHAHLCFGPHPGVFVAKLDPTGAIRYFFPFGDVPGSWGEAIAVDASGHAYVTGWTLPSPNFPTTPDALRTKQCDSLILDGSDAFVAKINAAGDGFVYATYLCGNGDDLAKAIAIDAAGNAYVAGRTTSLDFPTVNALQPGNRGGGLTGFVAKLSPDGVRLLYSTYLGGTNGDAVNGIALDAQGNAYVTGVTESTDFPTTPGVLQPTAGDPLCGPPSGFCSFAFVTKIDPARSAPVYSTYLFGDGRTDGNGIAVDAAGNAYVVGETDSVVFPILDAFQPAIRYGSDAFVVKLNPSGTRLVYSSYFGGGTPVLDLSVHGGDGAHGIALDAAGNAYVTGDTRSVNFPTTPGAFQPNHGGGECAVFIPCRDGFVVKISAGGPGVVPPISLSVTPTELAPGGTLTATWAGIPRPTPNDRLVLYPLGRQTDSSNAVATWPTTGAASGTLPLPLPDMLPLGNYELRLLSPDPDFPSVIVRSHPISVVASFPDLAIISVATTPAQSAAGQPVATTVAVRNQGAVSVGSSVVDVYRHRTTAPAPGVVGDGRCTIPPLAAGGIASCNATVTYATAGMFSLWAQVDTGRTIAESNEANNVFGPRALTVAAVSAPDLVETRITNPPAGLVVGASFAVTDTAQNMGTVNAGASTTRYYLSLDGTKSTGDRLLTGTRSVPILGPRATSNATLTVKVPAGTASATYLLLACADDTRLVAESSETNNCRAAATTVRVTGADLVESVLGTPPASVPVGGSFAVTDTVLNQGDATAAASTTRYYLSLDTTKGSGDKLLTGTRTVSSLARGAASSGTLRVSVPAGTTAGAYFLLACADDTNLVAERVETNNCRASATTIRVTGTDLVEAAVRNPPASTLIGTSFTANDTVRNQGNGPAAASTTRYYLSLDPTRNSGDRLLTGSRAVPALAAAASSTGTATLTVPTTTVRGTYFLLACADDTRFVAETIETNNCRASATTVQVTGPDLVQTILDALAASVRLGGSFAVSDTVRNQGNARAARSTTRYYLSLDATRNTGDRLLTGSRAVPEVAAAASSPGTGTVTVPTHDDPGHVFPPRLRRRYAARSRDGREQQLSRLDHHRHCDAVTTSDSERAASAAPFGVAAQSVRGSARPRAAASDRQPASSRN
jgi:subtilase family serine protease